MSNEFDTRRAEWIAREALAERMIPLIGGLYREHGVVTSIHGRRLINSSAIAILKAHRFARQAGEEELPLAETMHVLEALREIGPGPASIDVARLVARHRDSGAEGDGAARRLPPCRTRPRARRHAARPRHPAPTSCSTASAASAACSPAS